MKLPSLTLALLVVALSSASGTPRAARPPPSPASSRTAGGGVLPGANVLVASNATGTKYEAITNGTGLYTVPALSAGVYTVTISLQGFRTSVISDVRVQLGVPTTVNARWPSASWPRRSPSAAPAPSSSTR